MSRLQNGGKEEAMASAASQRIVRVPSAVARLLDPLPVAPLEIALRHLLAGILARHPALVDRIGADKPRRIAIAPTDVPFVIVLQTGNASIALKIERARSLPSVDATISGPLFALMGLVDGAFDGDALFFSRDLSIEGDMEAVLALRNAIDDADIDLLSEAAASMGRPAVPLALAGRRIATALARIMGESAADRREEAQ
ncbi:sterol-binding protein [Hyphomicrobium nitrativorans NL23]|uniref:Sterol-binding protein n=2 Tax=Hyphomicrobium TaxID=81 RepID=V5SBG0_9HYPH|nr:sterol-binding protein [Hyphomicrobium nitrativorans NL23]